MSYRKKHVKLKIKKITPKKPVLKKPIFWISLLIAVIIFIVLYFFLFFPGVQVENIEIAGSGQVGAEIIENLIRNNIGTKFLNIGNLRLESKSIFLANMAQLQKIILSAFPEIEKAEAKKQFPQKITLVVTERKPVAVFCQEGQTCFLIDKNGVIFKAAENASLNGMAIIRQTPAFNSVFIGDAVVEKKTMDLIYKLNADLKESFQINIKEAVVYGSFRLDIKTNENWQAYFDLNSEPDLQVIKLHSLLKDEIAQKNRSKLLYIDLRFKDRAYYK